MKNTNQHNYCFLLLFLWFVGLPATAVDVATIDSKLLAMHRGPQRPKVDCFTSLFETLELDHSDYYHGVKVDDPYRWLENHDSVEVADWVNSRDEYARQILSKQSGFNEIYSRAARYGHDYIGLPSGCSRRYFFSASNGCKPRLYSLSAYNALPVEVFDPSKVVDGWKVEDTSVSPNEKVLGYSIMKSSSDWVEWNFRELTGAKRVLSDKIRWTQFGALEWTPDSTGFYYASIERPTNKFDPVTRVGCSKVYYHKLGTPQRLDKMIYQRANADAVAAISKSGKFVVLFTYSREGWGVLIKPRDRDDSPTVEMFRPAENVYFYIGDLPNHDLVFSTDLNAPHKKIISVDMKDFLSGKLTIHDVIPEQGATIADCLCVDGHLIVKFIRDGLVFICDYDCNGKLLRQLDFPSNTDITLTSGLNECFFEVSNFLMPPIQYRYDFKTRKLHEMHRVKPAFDARSYCLERVMYQSKDGTNIPMYIAHKKDLNLKNGLNPTLIYGYGGFRHYETPRYRSFNVAWLDMGGIYCMPLIRGGMENGMDWYRSGTGIHKQTSFDDFIAAAEWLIEEKYTCPQKLAISGSSNGGLLIGACITQRPELFKAASVDSGVLDMVRFNRFGPGWKYETEYGSPTNPKEFEALYAYSPLHRVVPRKYPAILITAGRLDDRLHPAHSYKFAAALAACQTGSEPILLQVIDSRHCEFDFDFEVNKMRFLAGSLEIDVSCKLSHPQSCSECGKPCIRRVFFPNFLPRRK